MYTTLDLPFLSTRDHRPELEDHPHDESNHEQQERHRPSDDSGHVEPIGMGFPILLHRGFAKQRGVSRMTPEPDRENISHKRDCPDRAIDQEIETHARQHNSWNLQARRDAKNDRADEIGDDIANSGNKPQHRVQADIPRRARDFDRRIQRLGQNVRDRQQMLTRFITRLSFSQRFPRRMVDKDNRLDCIPVDCIRRFTGKGDDPADNQPSSSRPLFPNRRITFGMKTGENGNQVSFSDIEQTIRKPLHECASDIAMD